MSRRNVMYVAIVGIVLVISLAVIISIYSLLQFTRGTADMVVGEGRCIQNLEVVVDSQNNVHMVWSAETSHDYHIGNTTYGVRDCIIVYKKIDINGNTVVSAKRVDNQPSDVTEHAYTKSPHTFVDSNNMVHIAWVKYHMVWNNTTHVGYTVLDTIYYSLLDSNGNTIIDDLSLANASSSDFGFTVDSKGCIHVLVNMTYMKFAVENNQSVTLYQRKITNDSAENSYIAIDFEDIIYIAWADEYGLYYSKIDQNGTALVENKFIRSMYHWDYWDIYGEKRNGYFFVDMKIDLKNNLYLFWVYKTGYGFEGNAPDAHTDINFTMINGNGTVTQEGNILTTTLYFSDMSVVVDNESNISMIYRENSKIRYLRFSIKENKTLTNTIVFDPDAQHRSCYSELDITVFTDRSSGIFWIEYQVTRQGINLSGTTIHYLKIST